MVYNQISNIERLELMEERLGVALNGVSAEINDANDHGVLTVRGEITSLNGGSLQQSVSVKMSAFDSAGNCIATSSRWFSESEFFGINNFQFIEFCPKDVQRVRVFVTKQDSQFG